MMSDFKTELQKLIDDAAKKHREHLKNYGIIQESGIAKWASGVNAFKQGCEYLMPLIETLLATRNNYINYRETECSDMSKLIENHDRALLNLLRGS